jgi:hypothetical protein
MNDELERIRKEAVIASSKVISLYFPRGTEENHGNISHYSRCLDQKLNAWTPENEAGALSNRPRRSVKIMYCVLMLLQILYVQLYFLGLLLVLPLIVVYNVDCHVPYLLDFPSLSQARQLHIKQLLSANLKTDSDRTMIRTAFSAYRKVWEK